LSQTVKVKKGKSIEDIEKKEVTMEENF